MLEILVTCAGVMIGQSPQLYGDDPRVRAVAPFIDTDVLAVVQLDLARGGLGVLTARLAGEHQRGPVAELSRSLMSWSERLRQAGAREVFGIVSLDDLPGLPLVVVPLPTGSDADRIGRILSGKTGETGAIATPACATMRGAVVAGTARAVERLRGLQPAHRAEVAAAFAAVGDDSMGLRLIVVPTNDTRRVFEELVPELPRELGGGPITPLTRGFRWMAAGLGGRGPSLRVVIAAPDADAAEALRRSGGNLVAAIARASVDRELPRLLARVASGVDGDRIRIGADAEVAASLIDAVVGPIHESAARSECTNNEKQIVLAMHNYLGSHQNRFPPAYTTGSDGKPLLSWRVLILPFVDQEALYKDFHLDEPWDSPHNRTLIARMPAVYRCPLESPDDAREGKTRYLAPRGKDTVFRGAEPVALKGITDGTSNTIILVDVGDERAVPWTKPDDWDVGPGDDAALKAILGVHGGRRDPGTVVGMADGAVRFLKGKAKPDTLRALFTCNHGEVLSSDDF